MAVILHFSSWGLAFNVAALLRLSEPGRGLLIADGLHIDCAKLTIVIDGFAVLINRLAVNSSFTTDRIPLTSTCILEDLIVTARSCEAGSIVELGAGAIFMTNLKMSVLTMLAIHLRDRQIVAGHEVLECRLIVSSCSVAGLKLGNVTMLLHGIPLDTICCLHNGMGSIGFLEVGTIVPEGIASIGRACFDNTIANRAQGCSFRRTGEGSGNQRCLGVYSMVFSTCIVAIAITSAFCITMEVAAVAVGHRASANECTAKVLRSCTVLMECAASRLLVNTGNTISASSNHSCTGDVEVIRGRGTKLGSFAGIIQHCSSRECCHTGMSVCTIASEDGSFLNTFRYMRAFCGSRECDHSGRHIHAISGKGCTLLDSIGGRHTFCRSGECNHARYIHTISCKNCTLLLASNSTTICSGEGNNMGLSIKSITGKNCAFRCGSTGHTTILGRTGIGTHTRMTIHTFVGKRLANRLTVFASMRYPLIATHNGIRSTSRCIGNICSGSVKDRCIVESTTAFAAGHLIPLTSVCSGDHTMGNIRLFVLRGVEHIHRGFFAVSRYCSSADMSACDLSTLQLEALHMGHIVAKAPISDLTTDGTGHIGRSGSYGRDGIAVKGSTIPCGNATKGSAHKSCTTTEAHSLATFYDGITDIGVGTESGSKTCSKTVCSCSGSGRNSTAACTAKYIAGRSGTAANTGNDPGCHQKFHAHTGSSLGNVQTDRTKVAVKSLGTLEICQCAEHPEENAAFAVGQGPTVSDELAHRRSKAAKEPDIHDQKQQLRTNHSAPGFEHGICGF